MRSPESTSSVGGVRMGSWEEWAAKAGTQPISVESIREEARRIYEAGGLSADEFYTTPERVREFCSSSI